MVLSPPYQIPSAQLLCHIYCRLLHPCPLGAHIHHVPSPTHMHALREDSSGREFILFSLICLSKTPPVCKSWIWLQPHGLGGAGGSAVAAPLICEWQRGTRPSPPSPRGAPSPSPPRHVACCAVIVCPHPSPAGLRTLQGPGPPLIGSAGSLRAPGSGVFQKENQHPSVQEVPPLPTPCRDRRLVRSASAVTPAPLDRPWVELGSSSFLPPAGPDARCFVSRQILRKVLQGCRGSMLGTMALAACQFMEEPGMEVQVRESKHPYNNNTNFEVRSKTCGWQDPRGELRSSPVPRAAPRPPPLPSPSQERASLVPKPGSLYHPVFFPGDLVLMEKVGAQAWGGGWGFSFPAASSLQGILGIFWKCI